MARMLAREVPRIGLEDAAELTLLAADAEPACFQLMARRWLVRLLEEQKPQLRDFAIATQVIAGVEDGTWPSSKARDPLLRAARGQRLG